MANLFDLIGRIFISLVFLLSGYNKIFNYDNTISWMEGFGIPGFLLWPAIVLEILLPIFIIIGYRTQISAIILAIPLAEPVPEYSSCSDPLFTCAVTVIFELTSL